MHVAAVLLAAGASRRLGEPKQLLCDEHGTPAVVRMIRVLRDGGCDPVIVVLGASSDSLLHALAVHGELTRCTTATNERWADGMGSSIACGVAMLGARPERIDAVLIAACDMPSVTVSHVCALVDRAQDGGRVASSYTTSGGRVVRGIPAVFPREDFAILRALDGDTGARALLNGTGTTAVVLAHGQFDLDTPDDVARWRAQSKVSPQPHA